MMTRPGAILGDQVGLGKTYTALAAVMRLEIDSVLLVVPLSLKPWWVKSIGVMELEYKNGGTIDTAAYVDVDWGWAKNTPRVRAIDIEGNEMREYILAHPEQFTDRYVGKTGYLARSWGAIVIDEVHKFKNHRNGKRAPQRTRLIRKAKSNYRWGLTGTPVAENPQDLWGLLNWVEPHSFRSFWRFVEEFCEVNYEGYFGTEIGQMKQDRAALLHKTAKPYILVRRLEDVGMELPPLTVTDVPLHMGKKQKALYDDVRKKMIVALARHPLTGAAIQQGGWQAIDLKNSLIIQSVMARFVRQHQIASDPSVFIPTWDENAKLEWLSDWVDGGGEPFVLLTRYRQTVATVTAWLKENWPGLERQCTVGTYAKLSHGHNLQDRRVLILWDQTFSRLEYDQAIGRVYRQGQERPVQVYRLLLHNTVDSRVVTTLDNKGTQIDLVLGYLRDMGRDLEAQSALLVRMVV